MLVFQNVVTILLIYRYATTVPESEPVILSAELVILFVNVNILEQDGSDHLRSDPEQGVPAAGRDGELTLNLQILSFAVNLHFFTSRSKLL